MRLRAFILLFIMFLQAFSVKGNCCEEKNKENDIKSIKIQGSCCTKDVKNCGLKSKNDSKDSEKSDCCKDFCKCSCCAKIIPLKNNSIPYSHKYNIPISSIKNEFKKTFHSFDWHSCIWQPPRN